MQEAPANADPGEGSDRIGFYARDDKLVVTNNIRYVVFIFLNTV